MNVNKSKSRVLRSRANSKRGYNGEKLQNFNVTSVPLRLHYIKIFF